MRLGIFAKTFARPRLEGCSIAKSKAFHLLQARLPFRTTELRKKMQRTRSSSQDCFFL